MYLYNKENKLNIILDTNENQAIGQDIIFVSNHNIEYKNRLIIDMGTCNKYILIYDNKLIGITITPGIEMKLDSIYLKTALLPKIKLKETKEVLGKNTIDCINIGIFKSQEAEINFFINKIFSLYPNIEKVYLTGGSSIKFKNIIKNIEYDPKLLIKGLLNVYNLNN